MGEVGAFLGFRQGFPSSSFHTTTANAATTAGAKVRLGKRWQRVFVMSSNPPGPPSPPHHRQKPSTFTSSISTDMPLYESPPAASFDEYLGNLPRVFRAMFPDKNRSQRLNKEEWRIQMLPLDFLFLSVRPVVDMRLRCKSEGKDYPPGVPPHVPRVLELQATRWELQGLENVLKPSHFGLCVQGALYSERRGIGSRLRGQLEMSISCVLPPALSLIPEDVLKGVSESVLRRLVENMKHKVNESLLSDFREFRRESTKKNNSKIVIQSPPIVS